MGIVLAIGLVGYLAWGPVYKRVKFQRGVAKAREANRSLDAGDITNALRFARAAIRFAPTSPEVNRTVARVGGRSGDAEALARWRDVLGSGIDTRDDWFEAAAMAVQYGRVDLSGPWIREAIKTFPDDTRFSLLGIRHFLRTGDRVRAILSARQALRKFPSDPEVEYEAGRVLAQGSDSSLKAEGARLLWDVAAGNSRFREGAVESLAASRDLGRLQTEALVRLVDAKTSPEPGLKLLALDLRLRLDPENRATSIRSAVDLLDQSTNPIVLARIMGWLSRNGAITSALPVLTAERCATNPVLMGGRLDALILLGRTDEIERIGAQTTDPVNLLLVQAARGAVAIAAGRPNDGEAAFRQVISARRRSPVVLSFVASRAEMSGMTNVAIDAHLELMTIPSQTLDAARGVLRLSRSLDDLSTTRRALTALNAFVPGDESVAGERAWVEAVFGGNKEFALAALEHLSTARTNQPSWRLGHALALWRKGDASGALLRIESGGAPWELLEPRAQAAYVAILGANNQREAARKFAHRVEMSRLHSQERVLVEPFL